MSGTVRQFKDLVQQRSGGGLEYWKFTDRSEQHRQFWAKLNQLGGRRIRELPPERVPDIDATVMLNDQEWSELEQELNTLL